MKYRFVFENNDLPGVMLGSAVQRLLHLYGVNPGNQILIVTTNEDGWRLGGDLQTARIKVAAIVEERSSEDCNRLHLNKFIADHTPVYFEHTFVRL